MKQSTRNLADILDGAADQAKPVMQLSIDNDLDLNQAYEIQKLSIENRLNRGEVIAGFKLGFTSQAKMDQMGVHEVIWGRLTDAMHIEEGGFLEIDRFIHPRVEPEIVFRISKEINEELTTDNVSDYFDAVAAAIEVIDSRYENFKFSLEDVVADNCSSSAYVIGEWLSPETSLKDLAISLSVNGKEVQSGNSNAILGNPIESLIEMSKMAVKYKQPIAKGNVLLAGAATSAEYVKRGDKVDAVFGILGTVSLNVK